MRYHEYKTQKPFFEEVAAGKKKFEIRADDREETPAPGDEVELREWDERIQRYTMRRSQHFTVGYTLVIKRALLEQMLGEGSDIVIFELKERA